MALLLINPGRCEHRPLCTKPHAVPFDGGWKNRN